MKTKIIYGILAITMFSCLATAIAVNEITTSAGDLQLNSTTKHITGMPGTDLDVPLIKQGAITLNTTIDKRITLNVNITNKLPLAGGTLTGNLIDTTTGNYVDFPIVKQGAKTLNTTVIQLACSLSGCRIIGSAQAATLNGTTQVNTPLIASTGAISIQPSGDTDDYIRYSATSNVPQLLTVGGGALDMGSTDTAAYLLRIQDPTRNTGLYGTKFTSTILLNFNGSANTLRSCNLGTNPDILNGLTLACSTSNKEFGPGENMTYNLGDHNHFWNSAWIKTTVTSDLFMQGNKDYLIREVETETGVVKQFVPKYLVSGCVETENETETDCWMKVSNSVWNTTVKTTETYDGDVIDSEGYSMKELRTKLKSLVDVMEEKKIISLSEKAELSIKTKPLPNVPITITKDTDTVMQTTTTTTTTLWDIWSIL